MDRFNAKFWSTAHEVESLILERTHVERRISLADFGGHPARWLAADWATSQCPCTAKAEPWRGFHGPLHHKPYGTQYQEWLLRSKKQETSPSRATSVTNLSRTQNAQHDNGRLLWCPVLHEWVPKQQMKASHLFPCIHGQATHGCDLWGHQPTHQIHL